MTLKSLFNTWFTSAVTLLFFAFTLSFCVVKVMREVSPLKQIDGPDPNFKDTCFHVAPRYDVFASLLSNL